MVNISKGLLGLAEGVDAQRDIGGLMYQEASRQEGRAYTEAMRKEAEERADLRQIATEGRADERYEKRLAEEERIWFERDKKTREGEMNLYVRQFGMESARQIKMFNMDSMRQIRLALDKATSAAEIERIKAQGDQMDQLSKQIIALHEHRPDDAKWNPSTKEWDDGGAWKDEVSALERKYNKAASNLGLTPLTEKVDKDKYGPHALQIYEQLRRGRGAGDENWDDLMESMAGDKESSSYKATLETIEKEINDFVNNPSSGFSQLTGATKSELRKAVLELFTVEGKGHVARDPGDSEAPPPVPTTVEGVDVSTTGLPQPGAQVEDNIDLERIGQAGSVREINKLIQTTPGGYRDNDLRRKLIAAQRTDPEYLLPRLTKERDMLEAQLSKPAGGRQSGGGRRMTEARLAKLNSMINQIQRVMQELPPPMTGDPELPPQAGLLNRPGMIQMFESGPGLDMAAQAVESRIA